MKYLLILALFLSMAYADQFTFQGQGVVANNSSSTETWHIGYGSVQQIEQPLSIPSYGGGGSIFVAPLAGTSEGDLFSLIGQAYGQVKNSFFTWLYGATAGVSNMLIALIIVIIAVIIIRKKVN
jgi:hypothetical protein